MLGVGLIACFLGFVIRIPLGRIIDDRGMGFFAAGMEVFAVSTLFLSYGIVRAVTVLMKYRMKREMYRNARRVFKNALFLVSVVGALTAGGVFFLSEYLAEVLVLEHMSYLAIAGAAPAIFLTMVTSVFRGYFQGIGTMMPTAHSKLLEKFIMLVSSMILGSVFYSYGLKVADLLKNREYASAYGAFGASLGLSVACLFGLLHMIFIYVVYSGTFKQQMLKDNSKYVESNGQIMSMLISTSLPYAVCALLYNMNTLVDQRIFNYIQNIQEKESTRVLHWGIYYGKYSVIIGIAAVLCTAACFGKIHKILQSFERQEYRESQEKLGRCVHQLAVTSIPCAVVTAVLAEPIAAVLFKGELAMTAKLIQMGSVLIVLFPFTYLFAALLQRIRKIRVVLFAGVIGFAVHLPVVILLLNKTNLGVGAVVCGNIAFYAAACVICFWGIGRYMQYSQEWIRTFAVTMIAAGVTGLIGMLLNKALLTLAGEGITLLICVAVCIVVYQVLLIALKGVREEELLEMPCGRLIAAAAGKLHLM